MFENPPEQHPSYGMASFSHVTHMCVEKDGMRGAYLFGSEFGHTHYVTLTISRGERRRDLSRDWYMGGEEIVSVSMSEAHITQTAMRIGLEEMRVQAIQSAPKLMIEGKAEFMDEKEPDDDATDK